MYYASTELTHHGILGMKWGIRRYQNEDGTLTEAGRARYNRLQNKNEMLRLKNQRAQLKQATRDMRERRAAAKAQAKEQKEFAKAEKKESKKTAAQRRKDVRNRRSLSEAEIQAKIKRLQMEKQLRTLSQEEDKADQNKVVAFIGDVGKSVLKDVAKTFLTKNIEIALGLSEPKESKKKQTAQQTPSAKKDNNAGKATSNSKESTGSSKESSSKNNAAKSYTPNPMLTRDLPIYQSGYTGFRPALSAPMSTLNSTSYTSSDALNNPQTLLNKYNMPYWMLD